MEKNITEKDLIAFGFTQANIDKLKVMLARPENKKHTLSTLIAGVSKGFFCGILCIIIFLMTLVNALFFNPTPAFLSYISIVAFGVLAFYYLKSPDLAWKAYKFTKRSN